MQPQSPYAVIMPTDKVRSGGYVVAPFYGLGAARDHLRNLKRDGRGSSWIVARWDEKSRAWHAVKDQ